MQLLSATEVPLLQANLTTVVANAHAANHIDGATEKGGMTMRRRSDQRALKKAKNLSSNSDLSEKTGRLKANISATREKALEAKLSESEAEQWQWDNSNAIKAYNHAVAEHGCLGEEYRTF